MEVTTEFPLSMFTVLMISQLFHRGCSVITLTLDEILPLLFFLTNVTNKKVVKTCFVISNLSFGLANVFTHVATKQ
jgi:hypothetical protein